jgi:hypothetical protein
MRKPILHIFFALVSTALASTAHAQSSGPYSYYSLTPCRIVDTRYFTGVNGSPGLTTARRDFAIKGNCGVPTTAKAVTINVTVTNASTNSWLTIWPAGTPTPNVSTINFDQTAFALANGAIVGLSANAQDLSVLNANGSCHVLIDVTGYFQ